MRFREIEVQGFGVWSQLHLADLPEGVVVVYGRNEAGKTTLVQMIRSLFFGALRTSGRQYLVANNGRQARGKVVLQEDQHSHTVQRRWHVPERGELAEQVQWDGRIRELLQQLDEAVYQHVFCVSWEEMQQLAALEGTAAARLLFEISEGKERISIGEVATRLQEAMAHYWSGQSKGPLLRRLWTRRLRLHRRLKNHQERAKEWLRLQQAVHENRARIEQTRRELQMLERQQRVVEVAERVADLCRRKRELQEQLESLGAALKIPAPAIRRLKGLLRAVHTAQRTCRRHREEWRQAAQQLRALELPPDYASIAARIAALREQLPWVIQLERQVSLRKDSPSSPTGGNPLFAKLCQLSEDQRAELKQRAARVRQASAGLRRLHQQVKQARTSCRQAKHRWEEQLRACGEEDVPAALAETQRHIEGLRQLQQQEEEYERLRGERKGCEERVARLEQHQVLPLTWLALLGIPFVLGVTLMLAGFFWREAAPLGRSVALLGLFGWVTAAVLKVALEYGVEQALRRARQRLEQLHQRIESLHQQRQQLRDALPPLGGPLEQQLALLHQRQELLNNALQFHQAMRQTRKQFQQLRKTFQQRYLRWREAQERLQELLASCGISQPVPPRQLVPLLAAAQLEVDRPAGTPALEPEPEELLQLVRQRVDQLCRELGWAPSTSPLSSLIAQLAQWSAEQQENLLQARRLRSRMRRHRRRALRCKRIGRRCWRQTRRLMARYGCSSLDQLKEQLQRYGQREELCREVEAIRQQLQTACGDLEIQEVEAAAADAELSNRRRDLQQRRAALARELEERCARGGMWEEAMNQLAADDSGPALRASAALVNRRLRHAAVCWTRLALAHQLVLRLRQYCQEHRQPWTLQQASKYLPALTCGRFRRVWTPWESRELVVNDGEDKEYRVEQLSRGTREALFLAIRLALADWYRQRGIVLPLILDDVLVNLDDQRLASAAQLLVHYAHQTRRQVLYLTCHRWTCDAFRQAGAAIVPLPGHETENHQSPTVGLAPVTSDEPPQDHQNAVDAAVQQGGIETEHNQQQGAITPVQDAEEAVAREADERTAGQAEENRKAASDDGSHLAPVRRFTWDSPERWWGRSGEAA